jgi:hypothetical protein
MLKKDMKTEGYYLVGTNERERGTREGDGEKYDQSTLHMYDNAMMKPIILYNIFYLSKKNILRKNNTICCNVVLFK